MLYVSKNIIYDAKSNTTICVHKIFVLSLKFDKKNIFSKLAMSSHLISALLQQFCIYFKQHSMSDNHVGTLLQWPLVQPVLQLGTALAPILYAKIPETHQDLSARVNQITQTSVEHVQSVCEI